MEEFYLLDNELNKKYIIDTYSSAIWASRYNDIGDCELVISASEENFKKIEECNVKIPLLNFVALGAVAFVIQFVGILIAMI